VRLRGVLGKIAQPAALLWDRTGPDGFPLPADHPRRAEHLRITAHLEQAKKLSYAGWASLDPRETEAGAAILAEDRQAQARMAAAAVERWAARVRARKYFDPAWGAIRGLCDALFKKQLPFTHDEVVELLLWAAELPGRGGGDFGLLRYLPVGALLRLAERTMGETGLTEPLRVALGSLRKTLAGVSWSSEYRRPIARIEELLSGGTETRLKPDEPWVQAADEALRGMGAEQRQAWASLLSHCRSAGASRPSKRWLDEARSWIDRIGRPDFEERAVAWLTVMAAPCARPMSDATADMARGLLLACSVIEEGRVCRAVGSATEACYRKLPGIGARSTRAGNAGVQALALTSGLEGAAQLARLRCRVKYPMALELIRKALEEAGRRNGMTPADLEEVSLPGFGLDADGVLREAIGDYTAEIAFARSGTGEWRWINSDGKAQKSVPESVKRDHAADLKELKAAVAEIQKMLPAQRERLERLMGTERTWSCAQWRERYLDHPLVAGLARRLIWHFSAGDRAALAILLEGRLVDVEGRPLDWLKDDTRVTLWHPIGFDAAVVLAWRRFLEERRITQPFKQAHREIYVLTDAEIATDTYSNRFAAHILRQHQFSALCRERGWTYRLLGMFDPGHDPNAYRDLPEWGVRAELWVEGVDGGGESDMGIMLHVATDQVRFVDLERAVPRCLSDVPARIFSEAMRDVDLFVGVTSVGADPNWQDQGHDRIQAYWNSYAFGELTASAETRKELLERLLPRLKIASRCSLDGRFLKVSGDLRTYKIHLGSGNIMMEPNNRYLCIVPARGASADAATGEVFLPFEGDRTLAIILSKAFMLAEDKKIKEPGILSQIRS
jgi:hypothetical protein